MNPCWVKEKEYMAHLKCLLTDEKSTFSFASLFLLVLRYLGCLASDVFICSEESSPERFPLGEKALMSLLKRFFAPSLFFMEKKDVYPAPFLIPSSPGVHVMCDQPSDGCLKTSITKLKTLGCIAHERRYRCMEWGGYKHAAPMCLVHPVMAAPSSKSPSPFSLRKTLSWVVAILQAAADEGPWQPLSLSDSDMSDLDSSRVLW